MSIDVDTMIEALGDKIVRTSQGSFIKVDDLVDFQKQVRESQAVDPNKPKPKTFAEARVLAKRDPDLMAAPEPPRAPALSSVKGVTAEEEQHDAA